MSASLACARTRSAVHAQGRPWRGREFEQRSHKRSESRESREKKRSLFAHNARHRLFLTSSWRNVPIGGRHWPRRRRHRARVDAELVYGECSCSASKWEPRDTNWHRLMMALHRHPARGPSLLFRVAAILPSLLLSRPSDDPRKFERPFRAAAAHRGAPQAKVCSPFPTACVYTYARHSVPRRVAMSLSFGYRSRPAPPFFSFFSRKFCAISRRNVERTFVIQPAVEREAERLSFVRTVSR